MTRATIIRGCWVITGGADDDATLSDAAVVVEGGTIAAVGDWAELRAAHPDADVLGSDNVAIMPGLINAHHHSGGATHAQHGVTDELLESWLLTLSRQRPTDAYLGTLVSAARLLASGVTSVVDMHSGGGTTSEYAARVEGALKAYGESGMRVAFTPGTSLASHLVSGEDAEFLASLPAKLRADAEAMLPGANKINAGDYLGLMDDWCERYADHPLIDVWYGPPGPQWAGDELLRRMAEAAHRHGTNIQTHVEESFYEKLHGPRAYGKATMLHLRDLGVLGPHFSIAHGVWLTPAELAVMAETGTAISHNPSSNLRLRAGIAPLQAMLDAGVTVGLGMDGTTLNDDEDMFTEMRLALRLARTPRLGVEAPSPARVLELATAGGARLMRRGDRLGRLAPGYAADLVLLDVSRICWPWVAPEVDARELLVMRAKAADVRTVMVGGEVVWRDGKPTHFDIDAVAGEIAAALDATPFPAEAVARAERLRPPIEAHYQSWESPELQPYTVYNSRH